MLPFCHLTFKAPKPLPSDYPLQIKSLGDHIKKKRFDLKILQKEVAKMIGVNVSTLWLWEHNRVEPSLSFIPKIIEFLGYLPSETTHNSIREQIIAFRKTNGLTQKKLASILDIDHSTLAGWERGKHRPMKKHLKNLLLLIGNPKKHQIENL